MVDSLMRGGGDAVPIGRVLVNPKQMKPHPDSPDAIWQLFISLPSQTRPQRGAKETVRLTALAHELAADGLLLNAGSKAHAKMHKALDAFLAARAEEFAKKRESVLTFEGRSVVADLRTQETHSDPFQTQADDNVVNDAYRRTARILSPDIARTYTEVWANRKPNAGDDFEDALIEAREDIAALGLTGKSSGVLRRRSQATVGWVAGAVS